MSGRGIEGGSWRLLGRVGRVMQTGGVIPCSMIDDVLAVVVVFEVGHGRGFGWGNIQCICFVYTFSNYLAKGSKLATVQ